MLTTLSVSLLIFIGSLALTFWYYLSYKPNKDIQALLSQGASKLKYEENPNDKFFSFKKVAKIDPDTKALTMTIGGKVWIFFVDADLIKEVLTNHKNYGRSGKNSELRKIFNSRGITMAEGEEWKLHRRIVSEAFQYDLFNDMIPTIVETTNEVLEVSSKQQKEIKVPNHIEFITSEVITRIFFGIKSGNMIINGNKASEEATHIIKRMQRYNSSPLNYIGASWLFNCIPDFWKLKQRIRNFRNVFGQKIHERMDEIQTNLSENKPSPKRRDLLEILLQHRIKYNNDITQTLSDEDILDEFSVFFLAGKDTTSLLISMFLYCYVTYPEWGQKVKKEVDETIKDFNTIDLEILNSMDVMQAFINEVLRMYPPAPSILQREANKDHYVGNLFVKKGYLISTMFLTNNYSPKNFEEPEKFNPTRWLKSENTLEGWRKNPYVYLPFSAGPRNCVGKHLALMEAKTILSIIIKNFDVQIESGFTLKLGVPSIGYGPASPIPIILAPK